MSACTICEAPIQWMSTITGIRLPIDPKPTPKGNIVILPSGRIRIIPVEERDRSHGPRYTSHYQTCPASAEAKKGAARPK